MRIEGSDGGEEVIEVPNSVARALSRQQRESDQCELHSPEEVRALVAKAMEAQARQRVLRLVSRRDHSRQEVLSKLCDDGYPADVRRSVVDAAQRGGVLDDARFAESFVRGKLAAGWGEARIVRELRARGVEAHELDGWPYAFFDPEDELARARQVVSRRTFREPNARAKAVRFLVGRGFSYGVACEAARDA